MYVCVRIHVSVESVRIHVSVESVRIHVSVEQVCAWNFTCDSQTPIVHLYVL